MSTRQRASQASERRRTSGHALAFTASPTSFIGRSQGFGTIQFMTGGGPADSTTVLSYYMYEVAFQQYRFGYSAAIAIMSMIAVLILSIFLFRFQRGRGLYT